jgi:TRAP transporter TAXI family solute receptor
MRAMARRIRPLPAALAVVALLAVMALVTGTAAVIGRASEPTYARGPLVFATGSPQGVYYSYGGVLASVVSAELAGVSAGVQPTAGSRENIRLLNTERRTVAFSSADVAAGPDLSDPADPTQRDDRVPLAALARVYDDYIHLVVRSGSKIRTLTDLRGRRVSIGAQNSGTAVIARRLLDLDGIVPDRDLVLRESGLDDAIQEFSNGGLDAFFWSGGAPTSGVLQLSHEISIKLVGLDGYATRMRQKYGGFYRSASLPDSSYAGVSGVRTIAVANFLVVRADMDEGLAYQLTRLLFASRDRLSAKVPLAGVLDERSAIETSPVPLHPGAARYYRERR